MTSWCLWEIVLSHWDFLRHNHYLNYTSTGNDRKPIEPGIKCNAIERLKLPCSNVIFQMTVQNITRVSFLIWQRIIDYKLKGRVNAKKCYLPLHFLALTSFSHTSLKCTGYLLCIEIFAQVHSQCIENSDTSRFLFYSGHWDLGKDTWKCVSFHLIMSLKFLNYISTYIWNTDIICTVFISSTQAKCINKKCDFLRQTDPRRY